MVFSERSNSRNTGLNNDSQEGKINMYGMGVMLEGLNAKFHIAKTKSYSRSVCCNFGFQLFLDSLTIETYISENWISFCERFLCHSLLYHLLVGSEFCHLTSFNASEILRKNHQVARKTNKNIIFQGWFVTPWKINMEPTNHPFGKENDLPNLHDCVPC